MKKSDEESKKSFCLGLFVFWFGGVLMISKILSEFFPKSESDNEKGK